MKKKHFTLPIICLCLLSLTACSTSSFSRYFPWNWGHSTLRDEATYNRFMDESKFLFTKIREVTLNRTHIENSFFRETRTYLRFVTEATSQFKKSWPQVPVKSFEGFELRIQQAALDQDTNPKGEKIAAEQFLSKVNNETVRFYEELMKWADEQYEETRKQLEEQKKSAVEDEE